MKAIASSLPTDISSGPWKLDGEIKMMQSSTFVGKPTKTKIQSNIKINTTILYSQLSAFQLKVRNQTEITQVNHSKHTVPQS